MNAPPLLCLPPELIDQILSYLEPNDLALTSSTCRTLHAHAYNDSHWHAFVQENLPLPLQTPDPFATYRALYIAHHSHWFLSRHKIWWSDAAPHGQLVLARYDHRRGCIEGYTLVAEPGNDIVGSLKWEDEVIYHIFKPKVGLDYNRPVLNLKADALGADKRHGSRWQSEICMDAHNSFSNSFMLTRPLPPHTIESNTAVWPPLDLPSPGDQRTRNESDSSFHSIGHKPTNLSEASDATFRVRQWLHFSHFMPIFDFDIFRGSGRVAEKISTFATLPADFYTPSKEKPWQGIWCGDYSAHGPEFLVVTQPPMSKPLPEKARKAFARWPRAMVDVFGGVLAPLEDENEEEPTAGFEDTLTMGGIPDSNPHLTILNNDIQSLQNSNTDSSQTSNPDQAPYKGRLEAIKITGDPNVPRGQITFIADDLGEGGFLGYAKEPIFDPKTLNSENGEILPSNPDFRGARKVRSCGHIADRDFRSDSYIPSQLILIDDDNIAQYWMPWGRVSFYKRVNLDALLRV